MKNIGLKIFSLIVASLLAYFVHSDTNEGVISIAVPVEMKGLSPERMVIHPLVRQAQVSIKGPSFLLSQIYASPPVFRVRVPEGVGNRFTAVLNRSDLTLPPTVEILSVEPNEMEFTFDQIIKKELPVEIVKIGSPTEDVKISEISAEPAKVILTGPQTELKDVSKIETEPLDLREIESDLLREVALQLPSRHSTVSASVVKVKVAVSMLQSERTFEDLPIEVRSLIPYAGSIEPKKINLKLTGPKDRINNLKEADIIPYIKLTEAAPRNGQLKVMFDLPRSITVLSADPESVRITSEKEDKSQK